MPAGEPEIERAPMFERRARPSAALHIEFLMEELRLAHDRCADAEALVKRTAWRLVS